jgi:heptosyltransferase-2
VAEADEAALQETMEALCIPEPYAVIVPGATYGPAKSWSWRRYRDVALELSRDTAVVLAGTEPEREMCARIADGADNVFDIAGRTPLGVFLALLSRASVVVANDSGSPHLAASLDTPVVVLFGSTSPGWTAPRGPVVEVVRHPVPCSPCFRKTCPTQLECFDGITVDEVLGKARAVQKTYSA